MPTRREFFLGSAAAAAAAAVAASTSSSALAAQPAALRTYKVPRTDLEVTRIAYGCAMLGLDWNSPDFTAETIPLINVALEQGIRFFDLADVYGFGKAELALGQVLKDQPGLRNQITIQSKCGERFRESGMVDNSGEHIVSSVEGSLKRLGTDRLDILLLHFPDSLVEPEEVAQAFDMLERSGKVRYFGVSNHSPWQIELLRKHLHQPIVANQIQLGLAHWNPVADPYKGSLSHGFEGVATLDYCRANDIQVQAYSPLRAGNISRAPSLLNVAPDATPEIKRAAELLANIAKKYDATPAAIMLAWLLRHPAQIVPVIGGNKPEHVRQNCVADRIELTREEWYSLLRAAVALH
jgi:predicted oxidoreductase